jgi:GWxTD domain-containing protein
MADVAISPDGEGQPALCVSVSVPHPELQWVLLPRGCGAGAELMVSFEPENGGGRVYGGVWQRRLVVPTFEQTLPDSSAILDTRTFTIPPGRYRARISVRDLNADLSSSVEERLEVPDYSLVPLGLSDLALGTCDSAGRFTPAPTRRFGLEVSRLAARVALFDRQPGPWPRSYSLRYRILDERRREILGGERQVALTRSAESAVVRPAETALFLGSYVFELGLGVGRSRWRVDRSFEVEESGPPLGKEFTRMLEVLSYIAMPKEIEHLRSLTPDGQAQGWEEFWRRRDPAPGTERNEALIEFFRRVRYTESHFQGFGPGWRSDMGRIHIKYGLPDQVETQTARGGIVTLELWTYSSPYRRFVFEDRDGFGRFVLVSPSFE